MTQKEYQVLTAWLWRYRQALREETRLRERIRTATARATATTPCLSLTMGRSGPGDKIGAAVELLVAEQATLCDQLAATHTILEEITKSISGLEDPMQREVLELRYVDGLKWWQIANRMYISERWVRSLHRKALEVMQKSSAQFRFSGVE